MPEWRPKLITEELAQQGRERERRREEARDHVQRIASYSNAWLRWTTRITLGFGLLLCGLTVWYTVREQQEEGNHAERRALIAVLALLGTTAAAASALIESVAQHRTHSSWNKLTELAIRDPDLARAFLAEIYHTASPEDRGVLRKFDQAQNLGTVFDPHTDSH